MSKPIRIAILADGRQAKGELRGVAKETTLMGKAAGKAGTLLKRGMQAGLAGAAALAGTALVKGFGRLKGIEEAEAKLRGLGHEAGSVDRIMKNALNSVKGTAFGLDAAATTAAGAVAAGVKPGKQLERTLKLVGDAATIAGTDMNEMGAIWNKVASSDMIQGDVLAQLGDKGIPILQLLAKEMGVAATQVRKMASDGEIDFATFQNAMERGLGGAALKSGETLRGAMANAQAALGRLGASALSGAYPQIRKFFQRSITLIDRFGPRAEAAGEAIGKGLARAGEALSGLFQGADLSGAQKRLAAVRRTAETLWGSARRLSRSLADLARSMKPAVVDTFRMALDGTLKVAEGLAKVVGSTVVPAVEALSKLIGAIPGPLRTVGVQAGIAALVFPRLAAGAAAAGKAMQSASVYARVMALELRDAGTRATLVGGAMARMGKIARGAAGVGGMVALAQGASTTNREVGTLLTTLGGAAMGFAIAGPIGGAVGALGGLATEFRRVGEVSEATSAAWEKSKARADELKSSLNQLTGAATKNTRVNLETQLQEKGALEAGRQLGLSTKTLTNAILGRERATLRVKEAIALAHASEGKLVNSGSILQYTLFGIEGQSDSVGNKMRGLAGDLDAAQQEVQKNSRQFNRYKAVIESLPTEARTKLQAWNYEPTQRQVRNLLRNYELTEKQRTAIIKVTGVDPAKRGAREVSGALEKVGKAKANMSPWAGSVTTGVARVSRTSGTQATGIQQLLSQRVSNARFNSHPLLSSLSGGLASARGLGSSQGASIGSAIGSGIQSGLAARMSGIVSYARSAVANALAAMRAEAEIRSPSRKAAKIGGQIAAGIIRGVNRGAPKMSKAMRRAVRNMLKVADKSGRSGLMGNVEKRLSKVASAAIKADKKRRDAAIKRFNAEHQGSKNAKKREAFEKAQRKAQRHYERAVNAQKRQGVKNLRDEARALAQNANARKKLNDRLRDEKQRLAELRQERLDYIGSVRDTLTAYASLGNVTEGHMNAPESLLEQMTARVEKAEEWAAMVEKLRKAGLGQASLQQIIDAGVEGGFAQAQAILAGGPQMITALNALQKRTEAAGTKLGTSLGNQFFNAGIAAQNGLVKGLESDMAKLDKAATRLARQLVRALKRELKIKSPSRVMRGLGVDTGMGMVLGVGDTHAKAKRAGVEIGKAVQSGVTATDLVKPLDARALVAPGAAGARGGQPMRIEVTLSAQQVDQLSRGRQIRMDLDAWDRVGGRSGSSA